MMKIHIVSIHDFDGYVDDTALIESVLINNIDGFNK